MCATFHSPPPTPEYVCNHKDGNRSNNMPDNLEWPTDAENSQHALTLPGYKSNACALSKPVCGRRVDTEEEWVCESVSTAARELDLWPEKFCCSCNACCTSFWNVEATASMMFHRWS